MAKLTLTDITSGYDTATINAANNLATETALENTLSRDGTSPNQMEANLDMNSYRIQNLPNAVADSEPLTLGQLDAYIPGDEDTLSATASAIASAASAAEAAASAVATAADAVTTAADAAQTTADKDVIQATSAYLNTTTLTDAEVIALLGPGDTSWWDLNDLSTLWQDAARTTPVTAVGQTIAAIDDKGSAGLNLVTTHSAGVYAVDSRGFGYVDGGSLSCPGVAFAQPFTMIGAGKTLVNSGGAMMFAGTGATRRFSINITTSGTHGIQGTLRNATGTETPGTAYAAYKPGVPVVASHSIDTDVSYLGVNDQVEEHSTAVANAGDAGMTGWRVGYNAVGVTTNGLEHFYGGMLVRNASLSEATRRRLRYYLMTRIGLADLQRQRFDVWLGIGQSNLSGTANVNEEYGSPNPVFGTAAEFLGKGSTTGFAIEPLVDPVQCGTLSSVPRAQDSSVWPSMAERYTALTGRKMLVINGSAGSRGLLAGPDHWDEDDLHDELLLRYKIAKARIEAAGGIIERVNAIWLGGEADAGAGETKADWKAAFSTFLDRIRISFNAPDLKICVISIDRTTNPSSDAAYQIIRDAQSESATEVDGIEMVSPYQDYVTQGELVDSVHWSTAALNDAGARAGTAMAALTLPKLVPGS